jgi:hypothetical protein
MGEGEGNKGQTEAGERMRRAVSAAVAGHGSTAELQAASRSLVEELRRGNEAPEQVLLQIKQFLAEAGLRPHYPTPPDGNGGGATTSLYRDVITWTIQAYYDGK